MLFRLPKAGSHWICGLWEANLVFWLHQAHRPKPLKCRFITNFREQREAGDGENRAAACVRISTARMHVIGGGGRARKSRPTKRGLWSAQRPGSPWFGKLRTLKPPGRLSGSVNLTPAYCERQTTATRPVPI